MFLCWDPFFQILFEPDEPWFAAEVDNQMYINVDPGEMPPHLDQPSCKALESIIILFPISTATLVEM